MDDGLLEGWGMKSLNETLGDSALSSTVSLSPFIFQYFSRLFPTLYGHPVSVCSTTYNNLQYPWATSKSFLIIDNLLILLNH